MTQLSPRPQDQAAADGAVRPDTPAGAAPGAAPDAAPDAAHGSGWARTLSSLRHRNYRLYWSGQVVSLVGSWMQAIGQAWLVLELTNSGFQLGLVGALQALPVLLLSLFGGVVADRWPKRRVLMATQAASMLQAAALWALVATNTVQLWQIYVLALLLGLTNSLGRPASRAFLVELVGRADLPNAVALNSSLSELTSIAGPSLAGVIIAACGVGPLFLLNALSFVPVIAALALIRGRELHVRPPQAGRGGARQTTWQSLREGLEYVWRAPAVLLVLVVVGLVLLFGSNFNVVLPLFASDVLHVGARGFGFLSAASGVGSLLSALWLAWSNRRPTIRGVLVGALIFGALEVAFAVSPVFLLSLALIAGVGFMETAFAAQGLTVLQTAAPDHLSGRVMSVQVLFFDGSLPLGYVLMGWLSGLYGAPVALFTGAVLCLLVAGAGWLWRKPAERDLAAQAGG